MTSRWKNDRPPSLQAFMDQFRDEDACADCLAKKRWPEGFRCSCGCSKGWRLEAKPWTWECSACGKQTSVTAGTIMHGTHLPLRTWFLAAHLIATHSNGISALQLQAKLGIGSYKTAWLLLHKLRKAMVDPDRDPLEGIVEIDETVIPFRTKDEPVAGGQGRSSIGKMPVAGAVELHDGKIPGRIRLTPIADYTRVTLHQFVTSVTCPGSKVWTDGNKSYAGLPEREHTATVGLGSTRMWSCRGFIGSFPTSSGMRWAFITGSGGSTCKRIWTSSPSVGTVDATTPWRSTVCSGSG